MRELRLPEAARERLLEWFERVKRDLPWRRTRDPYAIWVSEVMLQQTQSATVIPYYERWMSTFPTVQVLAEAPEELLLSCWQGLGYYRRCRLLQQGARHVAEHGLPGDRAGWRLVPGVGAYTAGAVTSIAFNLPEPLVDGNVSRVYSRLAADPSPGTKLEKNAWSWARSNMDVDSPGQWNQALMELGATVCRPKKPLCSSCPLAEDCAAFQRDAVAEYPKLVKKSPPRRLVHQAVISVYAEKDGQKFGLERIPSGEWWEGMWRFPREPLPGAVPHRVGELVHTVTNHRIRLEVSWQSLSTPNARLIWFGREELATIPLPSPQRKAFDLFERRPASLFEL